MVPRVKICGITRLEDALAAVEAGADALGFMFYPASPRAIAPAAARAIIECLPPWVGRVGVFVNADEQTVRDVVLETGLDTVQLHGEESPAFCARFAPWKVIKAFRIRDRASLDPLPHYRVAAWLLDSYTPDRHGGTGARFNWDLAVEAQRHGCPIILAGGLDPANVEQAVRSVRPYGVDVSSGVESAPGLKDAERVRAFVRAAKAVG